MLANIVIGGAIFGYAGWALYRFINKSRKGKCTACAVESFCDSKPCNPQEGKG
ncbi:FeoB-associated Cys-rich membrane protein [Bacillus sp. B15-48]|uniref:FeoB-associated Cys-rich membrane protein n=1 Tax=Bacillus sp. B15-48 TaxID=1548601 RepID=UPI00194017E9|nr:FeoB-associated Cys-rich membrane protein [Bacillus sp. B15-48]MBM4764099.1 FeoB-associated Cys-rich membrane protein [Bacillus sp. B15-48]